MRWLLIGIIKLYQKTLSPDHGLMKVFYPNGFCRFYPTCSMYAIESLSQCGSIKGSILALRRIIRCNPWSQGGIDPVSHNHS